jgi:hypothetical protein
MLVGGNILRVWNDVYEKAKKMQEAGELPTEESWDGRGWGVDSTDVPRLFHKDL